jgi:hypothetical protein
MKTNKPNREQIRAARNMMRSTIFKLIYDGLILELVGLRLLRVIEVTLREAGEQAPQGNEAALYIEDQDKLDTWRAYPSSSTTIDELRRACEAFNVQPWVDLDGRVCLVMRDDYTSTDVPPDACALVGAMYGTDPAGEPGRLDAIVDSLPAFLKRQAE